MSRPFFWQSILIFTIFLGIGTDATAVPVPKSEDEALFVRRIVEFYRDNETSLVQTQIKQFLEEYPRSEFTESFLVLLGDMNYCEKNFAEAYEAYKQIKDDELHQKISSKELESLYRIKNWPLLEQTARRSMPENGQAPKNMEQEMVVFYLAESLYHQKNYVEAQPLYEMLLFSPCKDNASLALADIYVSQGNPKRAVELYLNLAKSSQPLRERFFFQAAVLQKTYNPKQSIETFAKVYGLRGKLAPEATLNHAILLYEDKQFKELIRSKDFYLKKVPRENVALIQFIVGRSYFSENQFEDTITYLRPLLQKEDDDGVNQKILLLTLIVSAHQLNQAELLDEWAIAFEHRYPGSPELAKVLYIKGLTFLKNKEFRDAELSFQRLILEFPSFDKIETVYYEKGTSLFKQGKWKESRQELLTFVKQFPKSEHQTAAYQYIARSSLEQLRELEKRSENTTEMQQQLLGDIQAALDLPQIGGDHTLPEHQLKMAQMLYDLKQYPQAIALLNTFMTSYPYDQKLYQAHFLMGSCCRDGKNDLISYIDHTEKSLKLNPGVAESLHLHGNLFTAYYQLSQQEPGKNAANHLSHAAENLYVVITKEKDPVSKEQLLWLANYYYQRVKNGLNEYVIEPLNDKEKMVLAEKALQVYAKILGSPQAPLSTENLVLEPEYIKVSNLHGWLSRPVEQIKILDQLEHQHKENPNWPQTYHARILFGLASLHLSTNEEDGAMGLLTQLIKSKSADSYITNASQLYFARLAFAKLPEEQKSLKNSDVVGILKIFKNLQIRKVLLEEPIHLEATIDYANIRSSLEPKEQQEDQLLFLLKRAKEDYSAQDDLYSKDYHAARSLHPDKDAIYQAYMMYLDGRIAQLEGQQARQHGKILEAERKNDTARILYKTLTRSQFAVSKYVVNAAKSHLEEMNK